MPLKRYQKEQAQVKEANARDEARRATKCSMCSNKGHSADDCPNACRNPRCVGIVCTFKDQNGKEYTKAFKYAEDINDHCTFKGDSELTRNYMNDKHLRDNCPVQAAREEKKTQRDQRPNLHCTLCDIDGHDLAKCRKKCNNPKCSEKEPHCYNDCELRRCKFCFARHPLNGECDYNDGKKYIIGQYKKNNVCECIAVNFWYSILSQNCISKHDKTVQGPFFKTYPKPHQIPTCPYGGNKCGFEFEPGKFCRGHHTQDEHGYFH
jgi:hypothetical protein